MGHFRCIQSVQVSTSLNQCVCCGRSLPTSGYAILGDGLVKAEFSTREGVESGALNLKRRFSVLQVKIYDAQAKSEREVTSI